jgi:carbonic anhydrase
MTVTDELLANNARYAQDFTGPLPMPPARHLAVVACIPKSAEAERHLNRSLLTQNLT